MSTNLERWNYCPTVNDSKCVANSIFSVIYDTQVMLACPHSCFEVEFKANVQLNQINYDASLMIYFESMTEKVHEELLLFDLSSFIGNFGGSLGLFIGFSYLDFATSLTSKLIDYLWTWK